VENSTRERTTCQPHTQWLTIDLAVIFVSLVIIGVGSQLGLPPSSAAS